jgi:hypothetical protein
MWGMSHDPRALCVAGVLIDIQRGGGRKAQGGKGHVSSHQTTHPRARASRPLELLDPLWRTHRPIAAMFVLLVRERPPWSLVPGSRRETKSPPGVCAGTASAVAADFKAHSTPGPTPPRRGRACTLTPPGSSGLRALTHSLTQTHYPVPPRPVAIHRNQSQEVLVNTPLCGNDSRGDG